MDTLAPEALRGSYTPVVTPFRDSQVDLASFRRLLHAQVAGGSHGIVVTGTSGEPSALTVDERVELYQVAVAEVGKAISVVAATGGESLEQTLSLCGAATVAGARALLVVTPYYIKPPQRGLVEYYCAVAQSTDLPVMIYHIPGRAGVSMALSTLEQIVGHCPNVVGMKHAQADLGYASAVLDALGLDFRLFAGVEELSFPMLAIGASGLMNAVGNVAPSVVAALCAAMIKGDLDGGRRLHYQLLELNQAVFWDTNPIPIKYLMWRLGLLDADEHRLPMVPPDSETAARLDRLLARSPWLQSQMQQQGT